MEKKLKPIGIGTFSSFFIIICFLWGINFNNNFCVGDIVLSFLNLPAWSNVTNGTHYTVFYSLLFLVPAYIIAKRYPQHLFAKTSELISTFFGIFLIIIIIFTVFAFNFT